MAHVRLALRRRGVGVGPIGRELRPPDRWCPHDAFAKLMADASDCGELSTVIEHDDARALRYTPAFRVGRMENALWLGVLSERRDVHERRVQEVMARGRNQNEREPFRQLRRGLG